MVVSTIDHGKYHAPRAKLLRTYELVIIIRSRGGGSGAAKFKYSEFPVLAAHVISNIQIFDYMPDIRFDMAQKSCNIEYSRFLNIHGSRTIYSNLNGPHPMDIRFYMARAPM